MLQSLRKPSRRSPTAGQAKKDRTFTFSMGPVPLVFSSQCLRSGELHILREPTSVSAIAGPSLQWTEDFLLSYTALFCRPVSVIGLAALAAVALVALFAAGLVALVGISALKCRVPWLWGRLTLLQ